MRFIYGSLVSSRIMFESETFDDQVLDAHAAHDLKALVTLYLRAASEFSENQDAHAYFATLALVYALEADDPRAFQINASLVSIGRASSKSGSSLPGGSE